MRPDISIVIPSYNRPHFLNRLLQSIEGQKFNRYEVIIVDDHSSNWFDIDRVISQYRGSIPAIKVLRNEVNRGAPFSRNVGIKNSRADWVALVDDDDEWMPHKLEKQFECIKQAAPELGLIYTWAQVEENGKLLRSEKPGYEGEILDELLKSNFIPSSSVVVRKDALIKAGLFDETFKSCQDWDMWVRLAALGYQVKAVKSPGIIFHKHTGHSIGSSELAHLGYEQFYRKHLSLYKRRDPYFYFSFLVKKKLKDFFFRNNKTAKPNSVT